MPVQIGSIRGKVDPVVERAITDLAAAVNALEQRLVQSAAAGRPDTALIATVSQVAQRVDDLNRRVLALENP